MIRSILIANRGEMAVRIIRTCREMGIRTVAVGAADAPSALYLSLADDLIAQESGSTADFDWSQEQLLAAAKKNGVDAIHPGYGPLAKDADFASAVAQAGLIFIGPSAETLRILASSEATADVLRRANALGEEHFLTGEEIVDARHLEFQIFGDSQGNLIHLGEREGSVQRRQQVLVAETPSPALHAELRARLGRAGLSVAKAVGYSGAGSVEFLLDGEGRFYFLGMQASLTATHSITEWAGGVDLVRWQIRIADGGRLPLRQEQVQARGHAIGCHIFAEDPAQDFQPSPGTLLRLVTPSGPGVRVDSGAQMGQSFNPADGLLAGISVCAEDRAAAVNRMGRVLREFAALGDLTTNRAFLQDVIAHPVFQAGETTTSFVAEHFSDWQPFGGPSPHPALIVAALAEFQQWQTETEQPRSPWQQLQELRV